MSVRRAGDGVEPLLAAGARADVLGDGRGAGLGQPPANEPLEVGGRRAVGRGGVGGHGLCPGEREASFSASRERKRPEEVSGRCDLTPVAYARRLAI